MHQSMHSGSMAQAALALPMSAVFQPNWSRILLHHPIQGFRFSWFSPFVKNPE